MNHAATADAKTLREGRALPACIKRKAIFGMTKNIA